MTLRVTLEIVPFGDETLKREIYRLDISNIGLVRNEGFGHEVCKYKVECYKTWYKSVINRDNPSPPDEWELVTTDFIEEHDRRDGAVALVQKATQLVMDKT
jgi:hypothetical protein